MNCIYQKNHQNNQEIVISIIKFPENFILTIRDVLENIYKINYSQVQSLTDITENGNYLCFENNKLVLVNIFVNVSQGYIYNSTVTELNKIYTWKLLNVDFPISCETTDESSGLIPEEETPSLKTSGLIPEEETPSLKTSGLIPQGETPSLKTAGLIPQGETPQGETKEIKNENSTETPKIKMIELVLDEEISPLKTIEVVSIGNRETIVIESEKVEPVVEDLSSPKVFPYRVEESLKMQESSESESEELTLDELIEREMIMVGKMGNIKVNITDILKDIPQIQLDMDEICKTLESINIDQSLEEYRLLF